MYVLLTVFALTSCGSDNGSAVSENAPITLQKPANFPDITYDFKSNPLTQAGVELGRRLFYEGKLSSDNATACGFCHLQESAFTHHGHPLSHGVEGKIGMRNAPPVQNLIFQTSFMWDGVFDNLNLQPIAPITSPVEMNEDFVNIAKKLKATADYPELFNKAFGSPEITGDKIVKAIVQFMATMVSANSKYDKYVRKEGGVALTADESDGLQIFKAKCATCHATDLFTDQSFRNTGLYYNNYIKDNGRERVTAKEADFMRFRVPSLRNIEKTAPYMHDGRFYTLEAVLNFYSDGVEDNPNLDPLLKQNGKLGIPLNATEKQKLIAFLKTLTDNEFLTDKRFAEF